jgi:transposase
MFDEFKSVKNTRGKMSFIYADAQTHEIIDILDSARKVDIREHFRRYSLSVRNQVKSIVIDMNMGYKNLIQELFPQASIIIDGFHIVQLTNRALNRTRIQVMNRFGSHPEEQKKYRKMKRYWRLPLKYHYELNDVSFRKVPCFQKWQTERSILDTLLSFDSTFKETYTVYQWLLQAYRNKDFEQFKSIVLSRKNDPALSKVMRTSLRTLYKHLDEINHTLSSSFSNGPLEGINNKIKNIKRTGYGFRNFDSLKARIVLACNIRTA